MQPQPQERLFTDLYDSVRQGEGVRAIGETDFSPWRQTLVGRLRFESLFSKRLVLSDAQLLDGAFFLEQEPMQLLRAIQRNDQQPASIEIRARDPDLGTSLVKFVRPNTSDTKLTGFSFSSILDRTAAAHVASELPAMPAKSVRSWRDVPKTIREIDATLKPVADRLESAWAGWIEAQEVAASERLFIVEKWDPASAFQLPTQIDATDRRNFTNGVVLDIVGKVEQEQRRSTVYAMIDAVREKVGYDERALMETDMLRAWYDRTYNRGLAIQHHCGFLGVEPLLPASSPLERTADESLSSVPREGSIELPPRFLAALGGIDSAAWRSQCQGSATKLEKWWGHANFDAFRRAVEPFVHLCSEATDSVDERWATWRPYIAAGGAVVGTIVGGIGGAAAGALLPEVVYHIWHDRRQEQRDLRQIVEHTKWRTQND